MSTKPSLTTTIGSYRLRFMQPHRDRPTRLAILRCCGSAARHGRQFIALADTADVTHQLKQQIMAEKGLVRATKP